MSADFKELVETLGEQLADVGAIETPGEQTIDGGVVEAPIETVIDGGTDPSSRAPSPPSSYQLMKLGVLNRAFLEGGHGASGMPGPSGS